MTNPYKQLIDAAALLEKQAEALDAAAVQIEKVAAEAREAKQAKLAADKAAKQAKLASEVKPAEVDKAKLAPLAKQAAATLREQGLISNKESEDLFAAQLLNHEQAIQKLAQLAKVASVPRRAAVVVDPTGGQAAETADGMWEKRAAAHLNNLHVRG